CDQSLAIGVALVYCCGARFGFAQFLCLLPGFAGVCVLLLTALLVVVYIWGLWFVVLALCPNSSEGGVNLGGLGFEQLRLWFSYLLVQAVLVFKGPCWLGSRTRPGSLLGSTG
ncbi:hypothetical protein Tco_0288792, partial [Tanacetum coccineum]